jgi:dCMP deaminase
MTNWDLRFLAMAQLVAGWSKDPSSKVGAVITDGKRIVSIGFNGFPAGTDDDPSIYDDRERKYRRVLHAEQNAMSFAKRDLTGCTVYITHPPCARCAAQIVQEGIKRVVCPTPSADFLTRWKDDMTEALAMFNESSVDFVETDPT